MVTEQPAAAEPVEATADPVEEAPPLPLVFGLDDEPEAEVEPESVPSMGPPETEPTDSPETPEVEPPPAPEKPDLTALLADLPDEEFEKLDRVARTRESVRRRAESETARRVQTDQETNFAAGNYARAIAEYIQKAPLGPDGTPQIDSRQFDAVAGDMWAASSRMAYRSAEAVLKGAVPDDYRIPASLQNKFDAMQEEVTRGTKPLEDLLKVRQEIALAAHIEAERPKLRKEIEAEVRKEMTQEAVVQGRKKAGEVNAAQPSPTKVGGAPTSGITPRDFDHAEELWIQGQMNDTDYRKWREHSNIAPIPR